MLKELWSRLFGGAKAVAETAEHPSVDYKGFRIRPSPYRANGQYQTAGIIQTLEEPVREHRFVRAETHPSAEAAANFAIVKAKQIIDEQGESMFRA